MKFIVKIAAQFTMKLIKIHKKKLIKKVHPKINDKNSSTLPYNKQWKL